MSCHVWLQAAECMCMCLRLLGAHAKWQSTMTPAMAATFAQGNQALGSCLLSTPLTTPSRMQGVPAAPQGIPAAPTMAVPGLSPAQAAKSSSLYSPKS